MTSRPLVLCLSHPSCGLCHARRREDRRAGWLPHLDPPAARRVLKKISRAAPAGVFPVAGAAGRRPDMREPPGCDSSGGSREADYQTAWLGLTLRETLDVADGCRLDIHLPISRL